MKKLFILYLGLFYSISSFACGGGDYWYYNFCDLLGMNCFNNIEGLSDNEKDWAAFFGNRFENQSEINALVFKSSKEELLKMIATESNEKYKAAFNYLIFAKEVAKISQVSEYSRKSWNYHEILNANTFNPEILRKGMESFDNCRNKALKLRYGYQIIRYLRYSDKFLEAIKFFNRKIRKEYKDSRAAIYYYCYDQIGGCYFQLGNYNSSAECFLKVYMNSNELKESARISFSFMENQSLNYFFSQCETDKQRATAKMLSTYYFYYLDEAKWIYDNAFDEDILAEIFSRDDAIEAGSYYNLYDDKYKKVKFENEVEMITKIAKRSKSRKDYWYHILAFKYFRLGLFSEANITINKIKELTVVGENNHKLFKGLYAILGSSESQFDKENKLYDFYKEQLGNKNGTEEFEKTIFFEGVKTLYLKNNQKFKAALITRWFDYFASTDDQTLIDGLANFESKIKKSKMDTFLINRSFGSTFDLNNFLIEKKGNFQLQQNNFQQALSYFNQLPVYHSYFSDNSYYPNYSFNGYSNIPKKVFSNNVKEGFGFDMNVILTDSICFRSEFSFIQPIFSKKELTHYLIKLNEMAKVGGKQAGLANYLLGNYYYNISFDGYFRNLLTYARSNYYNSAGASEHIATIDSDAVGTSTYHYKKALNEIENSELKAKTHYLLAKNMAYYTEKKMSYYSNFKAIEENYNKTKFYKEIINECKQFAYYSRSIYKR